MPGSSLQFGPSHSQKDCYEYLLARGRDLTGFTNVPPAPSDGSLQLVGAKTVLVLSSGNQERKGYNGFQDMGGPSAARTDSPGEKKGRRSTQRSTRRDWDFSTCFRVGRSTQAGPAKERGPKLSFQSLRRSGLGKLLLSVGGHRNGWDGLRYPVSLRPC